MKIVRKDISELKTFEKYGDVFTQITNNPETGWWLYERKQKVSGNKHFEVVKGRKYQNPDGSIVYAYPSNEEWGIYGYTVDDNDWAEDVIHFIMGAKTRTPQELYDFKKKIRR